MGVTDALPGLSSNVYAEMLDQLPARSAVVGIQPADTTPRGMDMDSHPASGFTELGTACVRDIEKAGGNCTPRQKRIPLEAVRKALIHSHAGDAEWKSQPELPV